MIKTIELTDIFNNKVRCYISNIAAKGYYYLNKNNFDLICCWWCGDYTVHEYRRPNGSRIAVASLNK